MLKDYQKNFLIKVMILNLIEKSILKKDDKEKKKDIKDQKKEKVPAAKGVKKNDDKKKEKVLAAKDIKKTDDKEESTL